MGLLKNEMRLGELFSKWYKTRGGEYRLNKAALRARFANQCAKRNMGGFANCSSGRVKCAPLDGSAEPENGVYVEYSFSQYVCVKYKTGIALLTVLVSQ